MTPCRLRRARAVVHSWLALAVSHDGALLVIPLSTSGVSAVDQIITCRLRCPTLGVDKRALVTLAQTATIRYLSYEGNAFPSY